MTAAFGRSGTAFTVTGFLIADVRQWDRGLDRAGRSLKEFNEQTAQAGLVLSAGLGAGLAASAAAAVRWESAFTGVRKTVDGTPAELRELEQSLLDLAQPLGLLPGQVAAIGETAGQLGIDTSGIDEFTEVIGQLTQTTVLQAEEAAFSLARFGEITQLTENEFDEFGSTLVALGNNFAATESEILELSTRLASYAEIAGFAEAETLGLATAAVAVGLPAEAAGTALGRVLNEMSAAVADGTDSLRTFADVAGLSVTEFSQLFETDAAAAFQAFVEGLATIEERGRSVTQVLDELGVGDARVVRTFQSLAGAGGLLGDALEVANTGWAENTALQEEFRQRAETAEFKLRQLQASLNELGIVLGEVILPIIGPMVVGLTEITQAIADLPEPVRAAIVVFTALGTAMIAVQSASTLLGARLAVLRGQLTAVGATGAAAKLSTLTGVMGRGGPLAVGIAVGITAIGAAAKLLEKDVESAAEAVERLLSADDQALRAEIEQALSTLDSLLARRRQNEDALRFDGATDEDFARFDAINRADVLANLGDQFQSFTTQGRDGLAVLLAMREELGLLQFEAIQSGGDIGFLRDAGDLLNASIEETIAAERERLEAMARSDARVEEAISTTRSLGEGTEEASRLISELATDLGISEEAAEDYVATQILLEDSTASAADELSRLRDELEGVIGSADEAAGINQDFERTLADLVEAADDAGTSLDSYTDAGQQNQDLLADAATGARDYADAILEQTGSVDLADAAFRGQIATLIEVAEQLGFTRGQVLDYLASLGLIPPSVVTEMLGDPSSALAAADAVASAIFGVPTGVNIAFGADLAGLQRALDVLDSVFRAFGSRAPTIEDFGQFLVNPSVRAGNIIGGTRSGGGGGGGGGGGADGPTELEIELERLAELYEFDRITRQEYIDALEALLGDYDDLSDEWVEIARQRNRELDEIAREEEEAAEEQERLLEKQTKALEDAIDDINKVLERRIEDIRDLSEEYTESIRDSINEAADVLGLFGGELTTPTQDEMIDRLEHRLEAAQRFADGIEELQRRGTPADLVDTLAAGGLGNLALVESLATGDQTGRILGLIAEVDAIGAGLADGLLGQRAPGFIDQAIAANPLPSQQAQQIVNIETNVTVLPDAEVITDAGGIERLFEDAAASVVEQVSDAVLVATRGGL